MFRDVLQRISFRGVSFHVSTAESEKSYNYLVHKFPGEKASAPIAEYLGEEPANYPIAGFLVGEDVYLVLSLLEKACLDRSPGTLYHPRYGFKSVYCTSLKITENYDRIGKVYIKLNFIDAPKQDNVFTQVSDELHKIEDFLAGKALLFLEAASLLNLPANVLAHATDILSQAKNFIKIGRAHV